MTILWTLRPHRPETSRKAAEALAGQLTLLTLTFSLKVIVDQKFIFAIQKWVLQGGLQLLMNVGKGD